MRNFFNSLLNINSILKFSLFIVFFSPLTLITIIIAVNLSKIGSVFNLWPWVFKTFLIIAIIATYLTLSILLGLSIFKKKKVNKLTHQSRSKNISIKINGWINQVFYDPFNENWISRTFSVIIVLGICLSSTVVVATFPGYKKDPQFIPLLLIYSIFYIIIFTLIIYFTLSYIYKIVPQKENKLNIEALKAILESTLSLSFFQV